VGVSSVTRLQVGSPKATDPDRADGHAPSLEGVRSVRPLAYDLPSIRSIAQQPRTCEPVAATMPLQWLPTHASRKGDLQWASKHTKSRPRDGPRFGFFLTTVVTRSSQASLTPRTPAPTQRCVVVWGSVGMERKAMMPVIPRRGAVLCGILSRPSLRLPSFMGCWMNWRGIPITRLPKLRMSGDNGYFMN
jgi:hypothetical protein